MLPLFQNKKITIIGLGYVGLPLAIEFGKRYHTTGFDINLARIQELHNGYDHTAEINPEDFKEAKYIHFTSDVTAIADSCIYIITVPTPVDKHNSPNLTPLIKASETVGKYLKKGDVVIYESTVYPGCTENICVPVLEKVSSLKYKIDFFCGYSPERINPGDKEKKLTKIKKIVSGSTPSITNLVQELYSSIITAGTYTASSITVAEAAKVIENAQRDLNIAFINELALIFDKLNLDTHEILEAANTKWNFLPFKPGLVGGHCIGVDPYYLTHRALEVGYHPEIILAGRKLNDSMAKNITDQIIKRMIAKDIPIKNAAVLILGATFKENCPDTRNSKVFDLINELEDYGCNITIVDPYANAKEVKIEYQKIIEPLPVNGKFDVIVLAVAHQQFADLNPAVYSKKISVIYDIKSFWPKHWVDKRL